MEPARLFLLCFQGGSEGMSPCASWLLLRAWVRHRTAEWNSCRGWRGSLSGSLPVFGALVRPRAAAIGVCAVAPGAAAVPAADVRRLAGVTCGVRPAPLRAGLRPVGVLVSTQPLPSVARGLASSGRPSCRPGVVWLTSPSWIPGSIARVLVVLWQATAVLCGCQPLVPRAGSRCWVVLRRR